MEGDHTRCLFPHRSGISIHSLRMEGDFRETVIVQHTFHFNPLPPHGGRLCLQATPRPCQAFQSTPSAWRETTALPLVYLAIFHFNPLPPHGGRQIHHRVPFFGNSFQSTPSAWRETYQRQLCGIYSAISIHSLRMEGDRYRISNTVSSLYFNPLPPHGGRPLFVLQATTMIYFNPLPPHGGRRH